MDITKVKISAFADEYSTDFSRQLEGLKENELKYMEIRGVDGKNISALAKDELLAVKSKLDKNRITVSSIGSPIGKIGITDDFGAHLKIFENLLSAAEILETKYIRMFSFFIPKSDGAYTKYRGEVIMRLERMVDIAAKKNVVLCHENERGIYGESPEHCLDLMRHFKGALKFVFDPANFIVGGFKPYPDAFDMLAEHIEYMHIKDASEQGIMPAGLGSGGIPDILGRLFARGFDNFLTVEPHLAVFKGIDELEQGENKLVKNKFKSNEEAFAAAVNALKDILAGL